MIYRSGNLTNRTPFGLESLEAVEEMQSPEDTEIEANTTAMLSYGPEVVNSMLDSSVTDENSTILEDSTLLDNSTMLLDSSGMPLYDSADFDRFITLFVPNDTSLSQLLQQIKLTIHSYLTMDQQWLRTVLYTHAVPAVNLPFNVGDVYPTLNSMVNITVQEGRTADEVALYTPISRGYIKPNISHWDACQIQWFELDGVLLPPMNANLEMRTDNSLFDLLAIAG